MWNAASCGDGSARHALDPVDPRQRRGFGRQAVDEPGDCVGRSAQPDRDAVAVVGHPAAQVVATCQAPHGRAKTDALHQATHANLFGDVAAIGQRCGCANHDMCPFAISSGATRPVARLHHTVAGTVGHVGRIVGPPGSRLLREPQRRKLLADLLEGVLQIGSGRA